MLRNFRLYLDIALFRRGPEDLPVSVSLLLVTILGTVVLSLLGAQLPSADPAARFDNVLGLTVTETALEVAWYWALLRLAGRPERLIQTGSAIFGVQLLVSAVVLVLIALSILTQGPTESLPALAGLLVFALSIWLLVVHVRIVQAATQWPTFKVVASVLAQTVLIVLVRLWLFPDSLRGFMPPNAPN